MSFKNKIEKIMNRRPWESFYPKDKRNIEIPNLSVYEYLLDNNKMTFDEFFKNINICVKALRSVSIREGDVVTICMPNTPEAVISFYAVNKIGAIANMLHPLSAEEEIKIVVLILNKVML